MKKKFLSYALVASMAVTSVPTTALADDIPSGVEANKDDIATYAVGTAVIFTLAEGVKLGDVTNLTEDSGSGDNAYKVTGGDTDITFKLNVAEGKKIEAVKYKVGENGEEKALTAVDDTYTIEAAEITDAVTIIVTTAEKVTVSVTADPTKITLAEGTSDYEVVLTSDSVAFDTTNGLAVDNFAVSGDIGLSVKTDGGVVKDDSDADGKKVKVTLSIADADAVKEGNLTITVNTAAFGDGVVDAINKVDITVEKATAPTAPSVTNEDPTSDKNKGKITGLDMTMEYRLSEGDGDTPDKTGDDITWTKVEDIDALTFNPGTYFVRVAETKTTKAGEAATVTIKAFADTDTGKVAAAKTKLGELVTDGTFTFANGDDVKTEAAVKTKVEGIVNEKLADSGVKADVEIENFEAAQDATSEENAGQAGKFTVKVTLTLNQVTDNTFTANGVINQTPYEQTPQYDVDKAAEAVAALKDENAIAIDDSESGYTSVDVEAIQNEVKAQIEEKIKVDGDSKGVSVVVKVEKSGFQAAVNSTADAAATNGSFTYSVTLSKDTAIEKTVQGLKGTITAREITTPATQLKKLDLQIESNGNFFFKGSDFELGEETPISSFVVKNEFDTTKWTTETTLAQVKTDLGVTEEAGSSVLPTDNGKYLIVMALDASGDEGKLTAVGQMKISGVVDTPDTDTDEGAVAAAKEAVDKLQESDLTIQNEDGLDKAALQAKIEEKVKTTLLSAAGAQDVAATVEITEFESAVDGVKKDDTGKNGSFKITITLKQGNATETVEKDGVITANPYVMVKIDETTVPVSNLEQTYAEGAVLEPTFGGTLVRDTAYTVSYTTTDGKLNDANLPTDAGTYTVTIAAKDANLYEGTFTVEFKIAKADQGQPTETLTVVEPADEETTYTITGVTTKMEYRKEGDDTYTTVTGESITGLEQGKYYIRYAADDNHNAGTDKPIGVGVEVTTYALTVKNGTGSGEYEKGTSVTITANAPEVGKQFKDWTITSGEAELAKATDATTTLTMKTSAVTVTANYEDIPTPVTEVTVTFDSKGGSAVAAKTINKGEKVEKPADPTKNGYSFKGWFTDEACTEAFDFGTAVTENITLYAGWTQNGGNTGGGSSSGGHSGGYGGGGGGKSSTTTPTTPATDEKSETTTVTNPDGSTTTTVTNPDGSSVETTTYPDGSKTVTETDANGNQTITETRADGTEIRTEISRRGEVKSDIKLPEGADEVTVKIPTENRPTAGTVAAIVNPDGTREILLDATIDRDGVTVTLDKDATIEIFDNAKSFTDVPSSSWAKESIDFVTARELFAGVSDTEFGHNSPMTRAMLMTVLARLDGQNTSGGATWYEKGMAWAVAKGISDGTNPNGTITREQLAAMLYRYAGSPATSGSLDIFLDSGRVSPYAVDALRWAVEQGIISGMGDGTLDPQGNATRAQVAAMLMRFMNAMS